jgi:serine/threonine-protein kinase
MEFVPWPQLKDVLGSVPDKAIVSLITQLVAAVRYLEDQGIVHRDIKPENIHVSPGFTQLKLLDLGVVRDFEDSRQADAGNTDQGDTRPFLATAQYSSPEYLFRLDEPTARLWKGLNIYQVGAVLHDLIKKEPLFAYEMGLDNRWLVARAVLAKQPSFADSDLERLSHLKALALRCLVKDLDTRLQIVGWEDFVLEGGGSAISALKARLAKRASAPSGAAQYAVGARLDFERREFVNRFTDRLRTELLQVCGTTLPVSMRAPSPNDPLTYRFTFAVNGGLSIVAVLAFDWQTGIHQRTAKLTIGAQLASGVGEGVNPKPKGLISATIQEAEDDALVVCVDALARVVDAGLAMCEAAEDQKVLSGRELYNAI